MVFLFCTENLLHPTVYTYCAVLRPEKILGVPWHSLGKFDRGARGSNRGTMKEIVIERLDLSDRGLTVLPPLFEGLLYLNCRRNLLTELPPLPKSLQHLMCDNNRLVALPDLPEGLETLICCSNRLTTLPTLPPTIHRLECTRNQLIVLPTLPANLGKFWCDNNVLESLPPLPASLTNLGMDNNFVRDLGSLPPKLEYLWCANNRLTSLSTIPSTIRKLSCGSNRLSRIPELPTKLEGVELACRGNPWTGRFATYMAGAQQHTETLYHVPSTYYQWVCGYYAERRRMRALTASLCRLRHVSTRLALPADIVCTVGRCLSGMDGTLEAQISCWNHWK
jgi:hypothetical protein